MELLTASLLSIATIVATTLFLVHSALAPSVRIKGKTNIPGNPIGRTWPIIGDGLIMFGIWNMEGFMDVIEKLVKATSNAAISIWLGRKLLIFLRDADIVEVILNSPKAVVKDPDFYKFFTYFSDGVFSKNGKDWLELRKITDVELPPKHMNKFHEVFAKKYELLCNTVDAKVDKGSFNMIDLAKYMGVDILLEALFGVPSNEFENNTMDFPEYSARSTELIFLMTMKLEYRIGWLFNFLARGRESKKVKKGMQLMTNYIVKARSEEYAKTGLYPGDPLFTPANYTDAILQYAKQKNWTEDQLDVLLDVMVAGSDTPAVVISAMCLYMAMYPEYQEKAYQEQLDVMGDSLEAPTMGDITKMPYLTMVMNETLRITGPPAYLRVLSGEIKTGGYTFPEGASVLITCLDIAKNPKYWERPNEFYPDHFLPELVAKRPKGAFLPFSTGSRSCAGKHYAETSSKISVSMLLRKFRFTTPLKWEEITYKYMLLSESAKGYPVEAIRRVTKT